MSFSRSCLLALCAALLTAPGHAHAPREARPGPSSPLPARKAGLWEVTLRSDTPGPRTGQTVLQCTSAEAEPVMLLSIVPGQENCREVKAARRARGEGYDIRTVCRVHGNRVEARMALTGDLQSAYEGRFSVQTSEAASRPPAPTAFQGRWLGTCRSGQRPGDMVLPNGVTVNVVDDRRRAEAHEHEHEHGHGHRH
ncbi:hypothetical protein ALDI51_05760 [Alicycliphilus denitrificans]|uniref:DUF3617 domain-containing protein n=1 Tax=Alicycliphilus denitrificans TaxID=179636 RepID=UPI000961E705|nr:DUF3617 family protein [Alicycliphilus denitrificans]MBN9572670.1 DUF3617 family protein [Alicycliphilus denitrificans]OJW92625.1 MAG: hypothetical protein BGO66_21210 [Alicycliphilus sp. 69-12]BCN37257.1 hypothetical protein ALDI51_05760 [Alicycliphilus denitrificans]